MPTGNVDDFGLDMTTGVSDGYDLAGLYWMGRFGRLAVDADAILVASLFGLAALFHQAGVLQEKVEARHGDYCFAISSNEFPSKIFTRASLILE